MSNVYYDKCQLSLHLFVFLHHNLILTYFNSHRVCHDDIIKTSVENILEFTTFDQFYGTLWLVKVHSLTKRSFNT